MQARLQDTYAVGEFDHGLNDVTNLAKKFEALLEEADDAVTGRFCQQYNEFKFRDRIEMLFFGEMCFRPADKMSHLAR
ncbi:hypothetical protein F2P79_006149 [Pimephales promelas]|nr:hypothetical protein F2P79_006149 [Pimephales promelas]